MAPIAFPDAHPFRPEDDEEKATSKLIRHQPPLPCTAIACRRKGYGFGVRMPLSQIGAGSSALSPCAVDSLLVACPCSIVSRPTPAIASHRDRHGIDDDVSAVDDVATE